MFKKIIVALILIIIGGYIGFCVGNIMDVMLGINLVKQYPIWKVILHMTFYGLVGAGILKTIQ